MLKIRLQRVGRKHDPSFRIVLTDSKNGPKSGRFLEILGNYDAKKDIRKVDGDRVKELVAQGAQVSDTVHNILVTEKVLDGKKINVLPKKSPIIKESSEEESKPTETQTTEESVTEGTKTEETPTEEVAEESKPEEKGEEKIIEEEPKEVISAEEEVKGEIKEEAPVKEDKKDEKEA